MYNPTSYLDDLLSRYQNPGQQRQSALPPLPKEEEDSMLSSLTGKVLGGVGYVGGLFDKYTGGRAVRGLLGGKPEELASIIPFSDALGITDESNQVSGKNLLENAGVLDKGDNSWMGTIAGVGADLLTSPATYFTGPGGALTKSGLDAMKAGTLPAGYAARAAQGLGGVTKFHIPLSKYLPGGPIESVIGAGEGGADFLNTVGKGASAVAHGKYSPARVPYEFLDRNVLEPGGRAMSALFNKGTLGATSQLGQEAALARSAELESANTADRLFHVGVAREMDKFGIPSEEIRQLGENTLMGPARPESYDLLDKLKGYAETKRLQSQELGVPAFTRENWVPRQRTDELYQGVGGSGGRPRPVLDVNDPTLGAREDIFRHLPNESQGVNNLVMDPEIRAALAPRQGPPLPGANAMAHNPRELAADLIRKNHLGMTPEEITLSENLPTIQNNARELLAANDPGATAAQQLAETAKAARDKWQNSFNLADWVGTTNPRHVEEGLPFFGNDVVKDFLGHSLARNRANASANAALDLLSKTAQPGMVEGGKSVSDLLARLHLGDTALNETGEATGAMKTLAARRGVAPEDLLQYSVAPEHAKDALRYNAPFRLPEAMDNALGLWDRVTNFLKLSQTAPWPGFQVRNRAAGYVASLNEGLPEATRAASQLAGGEVIPNAAQRFKGAGLAGADADVTKQLADLAWAHRVAGGPGPVANETLGRITQPGASLLNQVVGENPVSWMDAAKAYGSNLNPLKILKKNELGQLDVNPQWGPFAGGRLATQKVENANRLGGWLAGLEQGMTPEVSAKATSAAHYNYGDLAPFETEVMKRLVPYYSWQRSNLPYIASSVAKDPGGVYGTAIRATNAVQKDRDTGFVPPYLGGGMALPIGGEENGTQRYLTSLGLPFEDLGLLKAGPRGVQNTMMALAGQLNPMIKGPLEYATGKQFFTGRDTQDLWSQTGYPALDQLGMNSPASRVLTTGRQLLDPRKSIIDKLLNLGTGAKISDVEIEKQRDIAAREAINDMLRGQQGVNRFETLSVKKENLGLLSPEEIAYLRLSKNLEQRAKERGKAKAPATPQ